MNNEDYWKKRAEEREAEWTKKSKDTIEKELAEYYRRALSRITDDIAILYGRYAKDNNLTYAEASKLLTSKEFKQWRMSLEEYLDAIDKTADNKLLLELNTLAMRKRISRLDKLYGDTLKNLYRLGTDSENGMTKFLSGAYKDNYYKNLFDIGKTIGIKSSVSEVDDKKIRKVLNNSWSGKNYSQRIWKNTDKLSKLIKNEITDGFHRGVSINKMAKLVQQRMNVGKYEATRLVRTEMNYVQNKAALDSIKDSDMKYYIFLATLDKKTSTVCRAHDRKVYPVDSATPGTNMPPLHPHCRSTIAGNLTEIDTGRGSRTAKNDKGNRIIIPAAMNYDDYYKIYIEKSMSYSQWEKINKKPTVKKDDIIKITKYEEVESALINKVGFAKVESSFSKVDKTLAVEVTNQLMKLENKFGVIHVSKNPTICSLSNGQALAYTSCKITNPVDQNLSLCPVGFSNRIRYIENQKEMIKDGFKMPVADENLSVYTVTHEYGHMLQNKLVYDEMVDYGLEKLQATINYNKRTKKGIFSRFYKIIDNVQMKCFREIVNIANKNNKNFKIKDNISGYGNSNFAEFFAEVFTNSQLGKPNELGKAMLEWLKMKGHDIDD